MEERVNDQLTDFLKVAEQHNLPPETAAQIYTAISLKRIADGLGGRVPFQSAIQEIRDQLQWVARAARTSRSPAAILPKMRVSKTGKSIYLTVTIWYDEDQDRIDIVGPKKSPELTGFHTHVNDNPQSARGHPSLFRHLAHCMEEAGVPGPQPAQ